MGIFLLTQSKTSNNLLQGLLTVQQNCGSTLPDTSLSVPRTRRSSTRRGFLPYLRYLNEVLLVLDELNELYTGVNNTFLPVRQRRQN